MLPEKPSFWALIKEKWQNWTASTPDANEQKNSAVQSLVKPKAALNKPENGDKSRPPIPPANRRPRRNKRPNKPPQPRRENDNSVTEQT
jgi:hypothetical protein